MKAPGGVYNECVFTHNERTEFMKKKYLVLADGTAFEGYGFGADVESIGELIFHTGVVGYIETLSDPSYYGQIILQTFPMVGNYGIIPDDFVENCTVKGYVVREWCDTPSNFRCQYNLDTYLKEQGVPGIYGVDTRQLTRIIRDSGMMNAMICDEIPAHLTAIKEYKILNSVNAVAADELKIYTPEGEASKKVAMINYGATNGMAKELTMRGAEVIEVNYDATAEEILALNPDGIFLSNGPGNPQENTACIKELKKLMGKVPIFGYGLGHQLLALANGAKVERMTFGHHGANQPVKDLFGTQTYITKQNHGYMVVSDSVINGKVRYINVNDKTCEGIGYEDANAFTVQFYPESASGPMNTGFLFDRFIEMMGGKD